MVNEEELKQASNSERLYAILNAMTGDSDSSLWNINGVATLASLAVAYVQQDRDQLPD